MNPAATSPTSRRSPAIKTTQRYLGDSTELRREAVNRLTLPEPAESR